MSFFTFQNVSYVIDVDGGKIPAEKNFWHYLLYASYFPYIVSGPVNRYEKMKPQFFAEHTFDKDIFYQGMLRILRIGDCLSYLQCSCSHCSFIWISVGVWTLFWGYRNFSE